ncbi:M16 family metallopeptidase [Pontibacter mangrovi]|uniref:Insulinase family protein n=1 Tax=Pontibacter mangrovi TaxID=2589816 RepID=A0A501W268_9BACT|nr:M16 family metallopeptidase [Pontibacter mangrovi]TPE42370.1 insulinase family protein [Pontibacter mangrovi]
MTSYRSKLLVLLAVLWTCIASAQELPQDPNLVKGTLRNGLTYYIYPHAEPKQQAIVRLYLKAGSILEEEDQQGLAHFLEHMAFNGTTHFEKNELITFLEAQGVKFGSDLNAHTSFDETVYKLQVPLENEQVLEKTMTIMADWAGGVLNDSLEIEKERGVVLEEWRKGQGASDRMRKAYLPVLLNNSRYAERLPIGKTEVLKTFPRERIVSFYQDWYRPDLMAVAVVGDVDVKNVEKLIRKNFKKLRNPKQAPKRLYYDVPGHRDTLTAIVTDAEATSLEFSFFKKMEGMAAITTEQTYQAYVMRVLFDRLSAERFRRVSEGDTPFRSGSLSVSNLLGTTDALAGGVSLYREKIAEGIKGYVVEKERIMRYGFTPSEIEKVRKNYMMQLIQSAEGEDKSDAGTFLSDIKSNFYDGHAMVSRQAELALARAAVPQVDSLAVMRYIASLQGEENVVLLLTAPKNDSIQVPGEQELKSWIGQARAQRVLPWENAEAIPDRLLPTLPTPGKVIAEQRIEAIDATVWQLSNGARVVLKPTHFDHDRIILSGFRQGGLYALDSARYVTGMFAKSVIGLSGAGAFSRSGLSRFLAGNTASATMVIAQSREGLAASADTRDTESMFQLLYLKWMAPNADSTTFVTTKQRAIESIENSLLSPSYAYGRALTTLLNGESYVTAALTPERVRQQLRYEDVVAVYKERFGSARGFTFIILGNVKPEQIKPFVEQYLASLPAKEVRTDYVYQGPEVRQEEASLVEHAGEAQKSQVNIFYQGNDFEFTYPYMLRQQLLEEVLKAKLRVNLREENGGVYGVGVASSSTVKPAPLYRVRIAFTCAPENVEFLVGQVEKEIARAAADPAYFEEELVRIKKQLLEERKKDINRNTFWSGELRRHFYYDLAGWEYFTDYEQLLNKITAADLARDVQKYLVQQPKIKAILMPKESSNL